MRSNEHVYAFVYISSVTNYCFLCVNGITFFAPKANVRQRVFIWWFLCNIFDVTVVERLFSRMYISFIPAECLTVTVGSLVFGWKLIYTVGKSSACAMIEILECLDPFLPGTSYRYRRRIRVCVLTTSRFMPVSKVLCQCRVCGSVAGFTENRRWSVVKVKMLLFYFLNSIHCFCGFPLHFLCIMVKVQ